MINSACFLNDNNNNYITSNKKKYEYDNVINNVIIENIKIFDFNGNKIKEINNSNNSTFFIDTYYDNKLSKIFIITGNHGFSQSYDYNENKIYFKYIDDNIIDDNNIDNNFHMSIIIDNTDKIIKMIESSCTGLIIIWNFCSTQLLNKIKFINDWLYSVCLWNKDYLFVRCKDCSIKLIKLNEKKIIMSMNGHEEKVLTIRKYIHFIYG